MKTTLGTGSKLVLLIAWALMVAPIVSAAEPITFNTPLWNDDVANWLENVAVPEFESRHPDISVEVEYLSWDALRERSVVGQAVGDMPDVMIGGLDSAFNHGMSLDGYMSTWDERHDFVPALMETFTRDGSLHALPYTINARHFFYSKSVFAQSGLDPGSPPDSWDDLMNIVPLLTRYDGDRMTQFPIVGNDHQMYEALYYQAGGYWDSEVWPDEAAAIKALEYMARLKERAYPRGNAASFRVAFNGEFAAGEVGILFGALNHLRPIIDEQGIDVVGVMPPLRGPERRAMVLGINGIIMSNITKHPDAAWKFMQFLLEPEKLEAFNTAYNRLPPRISSVEEPWIQSNPLFSQMLPFLKDGLQQTALWYAPNQEVNPVVNTLVREVLLREKQPQQAVLEMQAFARAWKERALANQD